VRLVLTAHPSEAKRKEVLVKLQQIADMLYTRDRTALVAREQRAMRKLLEEEVEELWQTRPTRATSATVADEVDFGLYFITSTIMDLAVDIYTDLRESLEHFYPETNWAICRPCSATPRGSAATATATERDRRRDAGDAQDSAAGRAGGLPQSVDYCAPF